VAEELGETESFARKLSPFVTFVVWYVGAKAVFVCTDGTPAEKETLKENLLPLEVNFLEEDLGVLGAYCVCQRQRHLTEFHLRHVGHPGLNAITEQWIAARANRFIGTAQSRFDLTIS